MISMMVSRQTNDRIVSLNMSENTDATATVADLQAALTEALAIQNWLR